jgi:hypothetical protein
LFGRHSQEITDSSKLPEKTKVLAAQQKFTESRTIRQRKYIKLDVKNT